MIPGRVTPTGVESDGDPQLSFVVSAGIPTAAARNFSGYLVVAEVTDCAERPINRDCLFRRQCRRYASRCRHLWLNALTHRLKGLFHALLICEKRAKIVGQIGMATQQFTAIRHLAGINGFQIIEKNSLQPLVARDIAGRPLV